MYWYSDMEGSRLDGGRAKVYFDFTPKSPLEGEVIVTIDHPDYLNYDGTRVSKYRMPVKYEKGAWRINDWDGKWVEVSAQSGQTVTVYFSFLKPLFHFLVRHCFFQHLR